MLGSIFLVIAYSDTDKELSESPNNNRIMIPWLMEPVNPLLLVWKLQMDNFKVDENDL